MSIAEVPTGVPSISPLPSSADPPPDLGAIADAWATLPPVVKTGILAMIKAAEGSPGDDTACEQGLVRHIRHSARSGLDALTRSANQSGVRFISQDEVRMIIVQAHSEEIVREARELFNEYFAILREEHGGRCFHDLDEAPADLPGSYAPPEGRLLVALGGCRGAGCVALRKLGEDTCEMKRLYVRTAFRGQGLGRRLVAAIITEARLAGYARMRLDTLPSMAGAVAIYRSMGFADIAPYGDRPVAGALHLELALT